MLWHVPVYNRTLVKEAKAAVLFGLIPSSRVYGMGFFICSLCSLFLCISLTHYSSEPQMHCLCPQARHLLLFFFSVR